MTRLHRDRLTWLTYSQLGIFGYFIYGFGPSVSLLRDDFGFTRTVVGLHGTALAVGSLTSALVVAKLVLRFGRGPVIWAGLGVLALASVVLTTATVVPLTLLGAFLGSFGGSFAITSSAPVLTDRHGLRGPAAVTEGNAAAAGVGSLAPLAIGLSVAAGWGWRPAMLAIGPAVLALAVLGRRVAIPSPVRPAASAPLPAGRLPGRFWVAWVALTAGIAVEFCLALWAADLLHQRAGLSRAGAAAAVTALVAGMFAGRVYGGRLALRLPVDRLLYGALAVNAAGFAVFWAAATPVPAVLGLFACGLGVALYFPLGLTRALQASDGRLDQASARGGLGAALASGAGPFVLGALADSSGIHLAMLVVPALLVVVAVSLCASPSPQPTAQPA